jgi:lipopolysaccharide biosynthesis glycosyltransferase
VIRIFSGFDPREAEGWDKFVRSLINTSSEPIAITPVRGDQRDGSNAFTYSRFLVPYLCGYQGWALWLDGSDMLVREDISKLWCLRESWYALSVVKHDYKTKHPRKYLGSELECDNRDYPRKNWSSVILWDCRHYMNRMLTPEMIEKANGAYLHRFGWLPDERIGELPGEWNHLVGEQEYNPEAKIAHFTLGIPGFEHYKNCDYSAEWKKHG